MLYFKGERGDKIISTLPGYSMHCPRGLVGGIPFNKQLTMLQGGRGTWGWESGTGSSQAVA